ncbi:MAG: hypothetical protein WCF43_11125 [Steroidobacteraceae bacterium]
MPTRVLHPLRPGLLVRWRGSLTGAWLACTLVTGCALGQAAGGPPPAVEQQAVTNVPAEMIEAALDDAANRSTTARADIKVTSAGPVTWPDGSLGCPKAGMMYTQALVAGYRIVLQAGDLVLNYHSAARGKPVFCPAGRVAPPVPADAAA